MQKYSLFIKKIAKLYLASLPMKERNRIMDKIVLLSSGVWDLCDIKKMKSSDPNLFRLRVGKYRVIYEKHDDVFRILIISI